MKSYLSKPVFLGMYVGGGGVSYLLSLLMLSARDRDAFFGLLCADVVLIVAMMVVGGMMWYKAWGAIQDGHARTTPGKAIGFLFIPGYNFYWLFQFMYGFAKDANAYIDRYSLNARKVSEPLFLTITIMALVSVIANYIPVVRSVVALAVYVTMVFAVNQLIDTVNQISARKEEVPAPDSSPASVAFSQNKAAGIVAVLISVYAMLNELVIMNQWFSSAVVGGVMAGLGLLKWGAVIYLGTTCRQPVLKIFAIVLPVLVIVLMLWRTLKFVV